MQDIDDTQEQLVQRHRGRPRKHADAKAARRAASQAYRDRRKARREAPTISSKIIDLSAVAAYKVTVSITDGLIKQGLVDDY